MSFRDPSPEERKRRARLQDASRRESARSWHDRQETERRESPRDDVRRRASEIKQVSAKKAKQLRADKPKRDFVRTFPCLVCEGSPVDPHHEPFQAQGGTAKDLVPLCRTHHNERHWFGSLNLFEHAHPGLHLIPEAARIEAEWQERKASNEGRCS